VRGPVKQARKQVLVLGDYRQTITVVRSLGRAGFEVVLGCDDPRSSTALSRHVGGLWVYDGSRGARFCDQLEEFLRAGNPAFVFPVGETPLRRVAGAASRFEPLAIWAMPDARTVLRCMNKRALYRLARALGIPTAAWHDFTGLNALQRHAREMGFPLVVKRKDSSALLGGRKALILHDDEDLHAALAEILSDADPASLLLQKFASGARHNLHFAAAEGELVALFQQKVSRTDYLDGTGIGIEGFSVPVNPGLRVHCERLLARLRYTGIGCMQFLVDEARESACFLELNPRMDSTAALPYRIGYDFPLLAIELGAYRKARESGDAAARPTAVAKPYAIGRRYHWLYGDLVLWLTCRRRRDRGAGALARWALASLRIALTSHHLTWDLRDPLPTLHMFWKHLVRGSLRRMHPAAPDTERPADPLAPG
jgi:predicted ATP-grasp superfamily ATP-dependent carboligase